MTPETTADIRALQQLNDDIDQLTGCSAVSPEADTCLKLAWWFTEDAIREETGACSLVSEHGKSGARCHCCVNYDRLAAKVRSIRNRL